MVYFDNAATTKISEQALAEYNKASECFYNPSSLYAPSIDATNLIESARKTILKKIGAQTNGTLIFTGSASEANNAVINSCITRKDKKYIFSAGEHSSIYFTAKHYLEQGYNIKFIPLNKNGSVNIDALKAELDDTVSLVSVIYVSNETGAINDIKSICKMVKDFNSNIMVHTDAVQAFGKVDINCKELSVDYLTLSAHKINGPKGVGALYIANPNKFKHFILGGEQEMGLRAGTENVPAIASFKVAVDNLVKTDYSQHKQAILDNLSGDYLLVSNENCVDNIISICFKNVRGETLEHMLEKDGYLIGTGSACNSKAGVNRVLSQFVDKNYVGGAVRISFGADVIVEDCKNVALRLSEYAKFYQERIAK